MLRTQKEEDEPLIQLKKAKHLEVVEENIQELSEISGWEFLKLKWDSVIPYKVIFALQTTGIVAMFIVGGALTINMMFGEAYAAAGADPTPTHTPPPPLPTRTSLPSATPTKTPWPTSAPQGKGRAMADIFTSGYEGFDNRFGSRLMGIEPDFEEYLLCFDGTGVHREDEETIWATWEEQNGFCMPGIFYSYSRASDILITSDVVHAIGLSEAKWQQINIHIYEHGTPDNYTIFCPAGVIAQTSKFCLRDNGQ